MQNMLPSIGFRADLASQALSELSEVRVPAEFRGPISLELVLDPVSSCNNGHIVDEACAKRLRQKAGCPICREPLVLSRNLKMREQMQSWFAQLSSSERARVMIEDFPDDNRRKPWIEQSLALRDNRGFFVEHCPQRLIFVGGLGFFVGSTFSAGLASLGIVLTSSALGLPLRFLFMEDRFVVASFVLVCGFIGLAVGLSLQLFREFSRVRKVDFSFER